MSRHRRNCCRQCIHSLDRLIIIDLGSILGLTIPLGLLFFVASIVIIWRIKSRKNDYDDDYARILQKTTTRPSNLDMEKDMR
jgi:nitrogen fixation-related uncharacterized protein